MRQGLKSRTTRVVAAECTCNKRYTIWYGSSDLTSYNLLAFVFNSADRLTHYLDTTLNRANFSNNVFCPTPSKFTTAFSFSPLPSTRTTVPGPNR